MMARAWPLSASEYSLMLPHYSLRNQKAAQTKKNRGRGALGFNQIKSSDVRTGQDPALLR